MHLRSVLFFLLWAALGLVSAKYRRFQRYADKPFACNNEFPQGYCGKPAGNHLYYMFEAFHGSGNHLNCNGLQMKSTWCCNNLPIMPDHLASTRYIFVGKDKVCQWGNQI
ncbi:hypothetical protein PGT21_008415 [Puccinia graminis f. sp. tritici]|uniref:Uncharacterized protein n=2 Tax=Puccinia graminis f. sp. tritici TaxID=56615 RepID=E3KYA4_PUCGT|nr:uncharacterized protein PGTG_15474 [Puccinia graminis f. sp. tritici CRL 75-36-700-3]EFP89295.2 hypothetical protein PGTG_15474 [Puccinia graminis f. sp. tritici CRL 75-36-700-3]KAA1103154.1 hypothetical protein PGT21_008415 [Puccinia graminis f. sp. tritici]